MDERRKTIRQILRRVCAPMLVAYETDTTSGKGRLKRISMHGMVVSCECLPERGDTARLLLEDPRGEQMEFCGTVLSIRTVEGSDTDSGHEFFVRVEADIDEFLGFYEQVLTS